MDVILTKVVRALDCMRGNKVLEERTFEYVFSSPVAPQVGWRIRSKGNDELVVAVEWDDDKGVFFVETPEKVSDIRWADEDTNHLLSHGWRLGVIRIGGGDEEVQRGAGAVPREK